MNDKTNTQMKNLEIYQKVTDKILEIIDTESVLPWDKPWNFDGDMPCNYATKRPYKGINFIMTAFSGFKSPYYLTANEIKKRGGTWKGKGTLITFWKISTYKKKDESKEEKKDNEKEKKDEVRKSFILRYYYVWNEEQIEGIEFKKKDKKPLNNFSKIDIVENIFNGMPNKPILEHSEQNSAYYQPSKDLVSMPLMGQFKTPELYYKTLFHELVHSTGHKTRLNREFVNNPNMFKKHDYSKEELVAELGASFIFGVAGIKDESIKNSASYIKGWRDAISNDPKLIMSAATKAQKAVDYILNVDVNQ